jgi:PPOX class probable F420-dependent enzyme
VAAAGPGSGCQRFDTSALLTGQRSTGKAGQRCLVTRADNVETCFASRCAVLQISTAVVPKFPGCRSVAGAFAAPSSANAIEASMLSDREARFLAERRIAHLATADRGAIPHVVPVCFVLVEAWLYITIDQKPKRRPVTALKRLRNIAENPRVAIVVDRYEEDWARLGWVMLQGRAEILAHGPEHDHAQALLRCRYPQLNTMRIADHPVIAVRIERVTSWGDLALADAANS